MTAVLSHLTKPKGRVETTDEHLVNELATENLLAILKGGILRGSTRAGGFIVGDRPAVCFYDAPLLALAQNVRYDVDAYLNADGKAKLRHCGAGLTFVKSSIYGSGGRPVIYDETETAKQFLPADLHWRIVGYNPLRDPPVDWTHEREWRVPGDFDFRSEDFGVLLPDAISFKYFMDSCPQELIGRIRAINVLSFVLG
jgi:hypothetical protein